MNLLELWQGLDTLQEKNGDLKSAEVRSFLRSHSPPSLQAIRKAERGQASEAEIRRASYFYRYFLTHQEYEEIIRLYDPAISFPDYDHSTTAFVGRGNGGQGLASYRRVKLRPTGKNVFEKIYINNSLGLRRTRWFYETIFSQLPGHFFIPRLLSIRAGNRLSLVYFEYHDNLQSFYDVVTVDQMSERMIQGYTRFLDELRSIIIPETADLEASSVLSVSTYKNGRVCGLRYLQASGHDQHDFHCIEAFIAKQPTSRLRFSHGDLCAENFYDNCLLDFDSCGMYPQGFDLALMLSLIREFSSVAELTDYVSRYSVLDLSDHQAKLSFFYFCFVFYSRRVRGVHASDDFLDALWKAILRSSQL